MRRRFALLGVIALVLMSTPWATAQSPINPDVDRNGVVNSADVAIVRGLSNRLCQQAGFNPNADVNGDCRINTLDANIVSQNLGLGITGVASPAPNPAGWNNTNVRVTFSCTGPVTSCQAPLDVTAEGQGVPAAVGTVVGRANAQMTASVGPFNIDKTAPGITITSPATDNTVTSESSILVTGTLTTPISPLQSLTCAVGSGTPFDATRNGQNFECQVTLATGLNQINVVGRDLAGNEGTATRNVRFETPDPPTIQANVSPAANLAGWHMADVTITFTCTNHTSCQGPITVSSEGAGQKFVGTATGPGGTVTTDVFVSLDKTAPAVTINSPVNDSVTSQSPVSVTGTLSASTSPNDTVTCNGVGAALNGLNFSCSVPLSVGANVINVAATDVAGNKGSSSVNVTRETTQGAPTIEATLSAKPNAAGWFRLPVTITFTCTNHTSCTAPILVDTDGEGQTFTGTAEGTGGPVSTTVTINLDQTAPGLSIASPEDNANLNDSPVTVSGSASDAGSGLSTVFCEAINGSPDSAGNYSCSVALSNGANAIDVVATDRAGNTTTVTRNANLIVVGPAIDITSPQSLALFNATNPQVTVQGTTNDPKATIVVTAPDSPNGVTGTVNQTPVQGLYEWQALGLPLREGHNLLTAKATNAAGGVSTDTLTVNFDTTAPVVRIDGPAGNATLTETQALVTGLVNDIVAGTVNSEQVTVTVNGVPTVVSNRTFATTTPVLLVRGSNVLTAVAKDQAGNEAQSQITVTVQDSLGQQRILLRSGNLQTAPINQQLPEPLVVQLVDGNGQPVPNRAVTFEVTKSDGIISTIDQLGQSIVIQTDSNGEASVQFELGTRTGVGNNQVSAKSTGFTGDPVFTASATVGVPTQINRVSGENQRGQTGQALPLPFVVIVYDEGGNPVQNASVTFRVLQGGGTLETAAGVEHTEITNSDGKADALLTLGQQEGVNNQIVDVRVASIANPAVFTASAIVAGNAANTTVSGVVLNNADQPIIGALASIVTDNGQILESKTDQDGRFSIANAPVGTIMLLVDGSPASTEAATYPFLAFVLTTVAGTDNTVGMPIYIPSLDKETSKIVGGDSEQVLTMAGVPGVAFKVAPNSACFPVPGGGPCQKKADRMVLSQVHADKVPMPPPNGSAPSLVWTLQPAGVKFDPPIEVQLPNTDGLAPGQVVEIYQFDHDLEQFVSVGQARVSADGSVITSDDGFGITKSGWGAPQPPPPPKKCTLSCNDKNVCTSDSKQDPPCKCNNTPTNDGMVCGGKGQPGPNSCSQGECFDGSCVGGKPSNPGEACDDGIFCTDPDKCGPAGVLCFGTKIEDVPGVKFEAAFKLGDDIKGILQKVNSILGLGDDFKASVSVKLSEEPKTVCCEQKQQKNVSVKKMGITGTGELATDRIFVPSLSFNARAVKIGVFVKLGLSADVSISGEVDKCTDNTCYAGSITVGGSVEAGVAAEDEFKVINVAGSCGSGIEVQGGVSCKEYGVTLQLKAFACNLTIELFDGWVAYKWEKEIFPAAVIGELKGQFPE